jgi:hypothetical protein
MAPKPRKLIWVKSHKFPPYRYDAIIRQKFFFKYKNPNKIIQAFAREIASGRREGFRFMPGPSIMHHIVSLGKDSQVFVKEISAKKLQSRETDARKEFDAGVKLLLRRIRVPKPIGVVYSMKGEQFFLSESIKSGFPFWRLESIYKYTRAKSKPFIESDKTIQKLRKQATVLNKEFTLAQGLRNEAGTEEEKTMLTEKIKKLDSEEIKIHQAITYREDEIIAGLEARLSSHYGELAGNAFRELGIAVRQANDKGVLFNDLAPRNVMVQETHGKPLIYFIDFENVLIQDKPLSEEQRKKQQEISFKEFTGFVDKPKILEVFRKAFRGEI